MVQSASPFEAVTVLVSPGGIFELARQPYVLDCFALMLCSSNACRISKSNQSIVSFSDKLQNSEQEIRSFLRNRMYDNKSVLNKNQRGKMIIKKLFNIIKSNPRKFLTKEQLTKDKYRAISDFISGMTDRFAINLYNNFK